MTGTGIGWNRVIGGEETEFGVSGLLYNTNLMPYDRKTNSVWSQQRLDCVNGELIGQEAETYSLFETSWGTWKRMFPESLVLNTSTGFSRNYSRYPYGDYRENDESLLFPVNNRDDRLPLKERVLGVIHQNEVTAYPFSDEKSGLELIEDVIGGLPVVVVRSSTDNFIVAFDNTLETDFTLIEGALPHILRDPDGNDYNIFGFSDSTNKRLHKPEQFIGYWFSWGAFYPNVDIYSD